MLYCVKCHGLCESGTVRCPNCKSPRLRAVENSDLVVLHRADEYTAARLSDRFDMAGIIYRMEPASTGLHTPLYDGTVMPTDKLVLVRYQDLDAAEGFSREVQAEIEQDFSAPEEDTEVPLARRLVMETLSILAFLILVMAAVFGTDAFAGWLKSLM